MSLQMLMASITPITTSRRTVRVMWLQEFVPLASWALRSHIVSSRYRSVKFNTSPWSTFASSKWALKTILIEASSFKDILTVFLISIYAARASLQIQVIGPEYMVVYLPVRTSYFRAPSIVKTIYDAVGFLVKSAFLSCKRLACSCRFSNYNGFSDGRDGAGFCDGSDGSGGARWLFDWLFEVVKWARKSFEGKWSELTVSICIS